jgi:hypothetical protein
VVNVVNRLGVVNGQQNWSQRVCCRLVGPRKVKARGRPLGADQLSVAGQWSVNTALGIPRRRQCTVASRRPSSVVGRRRHVVGLRMSRAVNHSLCCRRCRHGCFAADSIAVCRSRTVQNPSLRRATVAVLCCPLVSCAALFMFILFVSSPLSLRLLSFSACSPFTSPIPRLNGPILLVIVLFCLSHAYVDCYLFIS